MSLGQRDLQPFNLKVRLLALQGQLYDSDVTNPLLAAFGSFDLAFVIVFIVPLFVIALTHNVWSAERELGTWSLIQSQPASTLRHRQHFIADATMHPRPLASQNDNQPEKQCSHPQQAMHQTECVQSANSKHVQLLVDAVSASQDETHHVSRARE